MTEQWYSIVEYARTFAVSDMTVRRRIKTGRLKAVLKDGKYYIPVNKNSAQSMPQSSGGFEAEIEDEPIIKTPKSASLMPNSTRPGGTHVPRPSTIPSCVGNGFVYPEAHIHHAPVAREDTALGNRVITGNVGKIPAHPVVPETQVSNELIKVCQDMLAKMNDAEKNISEKYLNKISALENIINKKDMEIKLLKQQVEDLQLLVKIFEKKNT
jgi:hypothetical protein